MTIPASYIPKKEHLGDFVKTRYGSVDTAEVLGFNEKYEAVYASGAALVSAVTPVYKEAYTWKSANFFTGVNSNLVSYVTPVRDAVSTVLTALELARSALSILDTLVSLGVNILKLIIERILDLFTSVFNLLNPAGSVHMLIIPPKVGNVGVLPDTTINPGVDSKQVQEYKKAEKIRQDFIGYTNTLSTKLPAAIGIDVSRLVANQTSSLTGYRYLLDTLRYKLDDRSDLVRPNLQEYSYSAGVGLFLGTSAINQALEIWGKVNAVFSKGVETKGLKFKDVPSEPVILRNRIPKVNHLGTSRYIQTGEFSPTQWAVTVSPLVPSKLYIRSGITYNFKLRAVYISQADGAVQSTSSFRSQIVRLLGNSTAVADASEYGILGNISRYSTMYEIDSEYTVARASDLPEKLEPGYYNMVAIDYYSLSDSSKFIYLASKSITFEVPRSNDIKGLVSAAADNIPLIDTSCKDPMWIGAGGAIRLLPEAVGLVVSFIDAFEDQLLTLLDDALSWIKTLLTNLATVIEGYQRLASKLDELIELLQSISSLTSSVGISAMAFSGKGDADALYTMFEDYLSPNQSSSSSRMESASLELEESRRLELFSDAIEKGLLPDTVIRDGQSTLDSIGSAYKVSDLRRSVQDKELALLLGDTDPQIPSLSAALGTSYNASPIITEEMTTAAIILLGHSPVQKDLASLITLFDLLFSSDENATDKDQNDILSESNLSVDVGAQALTTPLTTTQVQEPVALFTGSMELTDDPDKSPFDFCP